MFPRLANVELVHAGLSLMHLLVSADRLLLLSELDLGQRPVRIDDGWHACGAQFVDFAVLGLSTE